MLWLCLKKLDLDEVLGTLAQLACVLGVAAACDIVRDDAGLIAAISMGLTLANARGFDVPARRPFFETLEQLIIGVLFVSISATVTPASLQNLLLPTLGLVLVLVVVTRPLVALLGTMRTELTSGERAFIAWMAPRGIVATRWPRPRSRAAPARRSTGCRRPTPARESTLCWPRARPCSTPTLTDPALTARYTSGTRVSTRPPDGDLPPATDLLFVINAEGTLLPVTTAHRPEPTPGTRSSS